EGDGCGLLRRRGRQAQERLPQVPDQDEEGQRQRRREGVDPPRARRPQNGLGRRRSSVQTVTGLSADVLARAQALLEVDDDAAQVEPEPPADSVGALGAVAYRWPDGAVAAVYAFDSHADALGARKAHLSALTGEGREHRA